MIQDPANVCLSVSMCVVRLFLRSLLLQFSLILTKLCTHDLCANTQKTGTYFRNFKFLMIFKISNLDLVFGTAAAALSSCLGWQAYCSFNYSTVQRYKLWAAGRICHLTIKVQGQEVMVVEEFVYLGSLIHSSTGSTCDISRRSAITRAAMQSLENQIWRSLLAISTKLKLYNTCILPVFPCGSDASHQWLRSSSCHQLIIPRHRHSTLSRRAFSVAGPMAWNALPDDLRDPSLSADNFRKKNAPYLFYGKLHIG